MPPVPTPSIIDTRRDQMFPTLDAAEIERVRRFGEPRAFASGERLAKVGDVGVGLSIVLAGEVEVVRYDSAGRAASIVTHGPGAFLGADRSWHRHGDQQQSERRSKQTRTHDPQRMVSDLAVNGRASSNRMGSRSIAAVTQRR